MVKEYIVYQGSKFTLEWYVAVNGKNQALDYFESLTSDRKRKITHLFFLLAGYGKIFNQEKFRYEGDSLYVLKASQDRFFCFFFDGSKIILTNAYEKKSQKMPSSEKEKALRARKDYLARYKKGTYYE